jgi:hypothetical protein
MYIISKYCKINEPDISKLWINTLKHEKNANMIVNFLLYPKSNSSKRIIDDVLKNDPMVNNEECDIFFRPYGKPSLKLEFNLNGKTNSIDTTREQLNALCHLSDKYPRWLLNHTAIMP